ncbi:MAG: hypothetical protein ACOYK7_10115, partial [Pirellulales bacterium]
MKGDGLSARDVILGRVREALQVPAPPPHGLLGHDLPGHDLPGHDRPEHDAAPAAPAAGGLLQILPEQAARPWLPDGGETPEERLRILEENLGKLKAVVQRVPDIDAAGDFFFALCRRREWQRVAWHAHPLVEPLVHRTPCATYRVDG